MDEKLTPLLSTALFAKTDAFDYFISETGCSKKAKVDALEPLGSSFEPRHDKTNKMSVRPAKTQISLGIRPGSSESSLCAQWVAKDPSFLHADSEDSDQTGRMPRLI